MPFDVIPREISNVVQYCLGIQKKILKPCNVYYPMKRTHKKTNPWKASHNTMLSRFEPLGQSLYSRPKLMNLLPALARTKQSHLKVARYT